MSKGLEPELIRRMAHLVRVGLCPEELKSLTVDLKSILGYLRVLDEVDVEELPAMAHPLGHMGQKAPLCNDEIHTRSSPDLSLREAPSVLNDQFKVPRTVELTLRERDEGASS